VSEDKSYPNRTDVAESAAMQADKKLKRELSFWDLLFLSMGGIIGSGWLLAVNGAAAAAGPGVIFSWIIGGILLIFVALTFAEVSGMLPRSGAIVRYPHYSHGSYTGFILGWAYLLTAVTVPTIEAEAVVTYASTYVPSLVTSSGVLSIPEGVVAAFLLMLFFFFLNYLGIKVLGKTNTGVTVWKFVIPTLHFCCYSRCSTPPTLRLMVGCSLKEYLRFFLPYPPPALFFHIWVSGKLLNTAEKPRTLRRMFHAQPYCRLSWQY